MSDWSSDVCSSDLGANATLGRYMKNARDEGYLEFSLSSTKIEYLGETFEEGETECDGVDDPQVRMAHWCNVQDESVEPEVTSGGFADVRLPDNGAGLTIYYGAPAQDIPPPAHYRVLAALAIGSATVGPHV